MMSQTNSVGTARSVRLMAVIATGLSPFASALFMAAPVHAAEREAFAIECPRTIVSPEAQKKIDAGAKPEIIKSRYKPGIVNPQGFCTITLSPNGERMFQIYNEATSVGQIPIRFEYSQAGLYAFVGEKALPLGTGNADMVCYAPAQEEYAVDCSISLTLDGSMFFQRKEGRGVDESSVRIDREQIFGTRLGGARSLAHYELKSNLLGVDDPFRHYSDLTEADWTALNPGSFYVKKPADCTQPYWKDVAQVITVSTGRRNGNALELVRSFEMVDADPSIFVRTGETAQMFPRFDMKNGNARAIIDSVMTSEVVQVDVETACEGKLSKAFLTELPRVLNHVYEAIKPRMLTQR